MMSFSYTVIAGDDFIQEVVKCLTPTVAFFVAKWSGNCHLMEPIIANVAKRFEGQIKFCKVDADNARAIIRAYGITELPTLLFFASGTPRSHIKGVASESEISKEIESLLVSKPRKDRG